MAQWLAGQPSDLMANYPHLAGLPDRVAAGDVYWVTILFEGPVFGPATQADAQEWHEVYPAENVALMLDDDRAFFNWVQPGGFPSVLLLDTDLEVQAFNRFSFVTALEALNADLGD